MQRLAGIFALLLSVGAALGCAAVATSDGDLAAVRAIHLELIRAYNSCNANAFSAGYASTFTFTTASTSAAYTTVPALQAYHAAGCRQSPSPQVTLKSEAIRVTGAARVLTGQYVFRLAAPNGVRDVTQNYTAVFVQEAGLWRVAAHHVSPAP